MVDKVSGYGNGKYGVVDDLERRSDYRNETDGRLGDAGAKDQDADNLDEITEDTLHEFDLDGDGELSEVNSDGINERAAATKFLDREGDNDGDHSIDVSGSGGDDDTGRTQSALDNLTDADKADYFRGDKAFEKKYGDGADGKDSLPGGSKQPESSWGGTSFDMTSKEFTDLVTDLLGGSTYGLDIGELFGGISMDIPGSKGK